MNKLNEIFNLIQKSDDKEIIDFLVREFDDTAVDLMELLAEKSKYFTRQNFDTQNNFS